MIAEDFTLPREDKNNFADPLQQQWADADRRQREALQEKRRLAILLRVGHCEMCGKEFTRQRVTRRTCSASCNIAAYAKRNASKRHPSSLARIREALPVIKAGGLLTERVIAILEAALGGIGPTEMGVSRQRVDQVLGQASKIAKTVVFMKAAMEQLAREQNEKAAL